MIAENLLILMLSLVLLVKGSDYFVKSASTIAEKLRLRICYRADPCSSRDIDSGTCLSIAAALQQASGIVIGNVVGSNIVNIGFIVGLAAVISPMKTEIEMLRRDGYIMLFAALLFFAFALNGELSILESAFSYLSL